MSWRVIYFVVIGLVIAWHIYGLINRPFDVILNLGFFAFYAMLLIYPFLIDNNFSWRKVLKYLAGFALVLFIIGFGNRPIDISQIIVSVIFYSIFVALPIVVKVISTSKKTQRLSSAFLLLAVTFLLVEAYGFVNIPRIYLISELNKHANEIQDRVDLVCGGRPVRNGVLEDGSEINIGYLIEQWDDCRLIMYSGKVGNTKYYLFRTKALFYGIYFLPSAGTINIFGLA